MKKLLRYAVLATLVALLISSCAKEKVYDPRSYWLSQERGHVVFSGSYCGVYVVETNYGYTIVQNMDGSRIYDGDLMYGNFGSYGSRELYNYTADLVIRGNVLEYDLTYYEAQDAIYYYCPLGRANGDKIKQGVSSQSK